MLLDHDQRGQDDIRACLLEPMSRAFLVCPEIPKNPVVLNMGANSDGFSLLLPTARGFGNESPFHARGWSLDSQRD